MGSEGVQLADSKKRWCLFCDLELHSSPPGAPRITLDDYVDDLIARSDADQAKRVFENESRVVRIAKARRISLGNQDPALAILITSGDRRGADPSFVHFDGGVARNPEKLQGEVRAHSAHAIVRLVEDQQHVGRHRMLIEEAEGLGRTQTQRILQHVLRDISKDRNERFLNEETGRHKRLIPVIEVYARQSNAMLHALEHGTFQPVELIDTGTVPAFDANPELTVRRHNLFVKAKPAPGRTVRQVFNDLKDIAHGEGYDRMRVVWRIPGESRGGSAEIDTDVADVGTAMFAHRVLVQVEQAMADCASDLNDEFLHAISEQF